MLKLFVIIVNYNDVKYIFNIGFLELYESERMANDLAVRYVVNVYRKWARSHFLFVVKYSDPVTSCYKHNHVTYGSNEEKRQQYISLFFEYTP